MDSASKQTRKRSEIWNNFSSVGENRAKCGFCSAILSTLGGSTGNLSRHMKNKHPFTPLENYRQTPSLSHINLAIHSTADSSCTSSALSEVYVGPSTSTVSDANEFPKSKKQKTTITSMNFVQSVKPVGLNRAKLLDRQLVTMIRVVKEYQPFRIVEDTEFKKFVNMLCPGYSLPSRKTISGSLIPQIMNTTKEIVSQKIGRAAAICLTTDGWTSINNDSFIAITAHYIDVAETMMQSNLLTCLNYTDRHTASNLASLLQDVVKEWNLENQICAVVTDNAANVVSSIRMCNYRHIGCFAHTINLIVQAGLGTIKDLLRNVEFHL
nr:unnamed protein product [Callosobruchus analis]